MRMLQLCLSGEETIDPEYQVHEKNGTCQQKEEIRGGRKMEQIVFLGLWVTMTTGIMAYKIMHNTDKIEIMSVRGELKKIRKIEKIDRETL